jgi:hypothetical protein
MLTIYFMAMEKHEANMVATLVIRFALFVAK